MIILHIFAHGLSGIHSLIIAGSAKLFTLEGLGDHENVLSNHMQLFYIINLLLKPKLKLYHFDFYSLNFIFVDFSYFCNGLSGTHTLKIE